MKEPKRVKKYLATLDKVETYLEYMLYGNESVMREFRSDLRGLRELLKELSVDKKEDRAKFFGTLKRLYKVEKK